MSRIYRKPPLIEALSEFQFADSSDVENEVVVLMPSKRERVVTVRVSYVGRAKPLIVLDDLYIEADNNR